MSKKKENQNNLEIKVLKIDQIVPYWRNPRVNDQTIAPLAESIKQFGFKVPIVVDKDYVIITGHARYKASLFLKLKEIPCIIADDLTPNQVQEYRLVDNKVSEFSQWDDEKLLLEVRELPNLDELARKYFVDVDFDSIMKNFAGAKIPEITENDISKKNQELNDRFSDDNKNQDEKISVICPKCYEEFQVGLNEFVNKNKKT